MWCVTERRLTNKFLLQVLPFIVLGIGLDDSFLLMNAYERTSPEDDITTRISASVDDVGASIAMTTLTSSVAFALGCLSSIPSVSP